MKHLMLAASLLMLQPAASGAQEYGTDTKTLMAACELVVNFGVSGEEPSSLAQDIDFGRCLGFIRAIGDLMIVACAQKRAGDQPIVDIPADTWAQSPEKLAQTFINYGKANPDFWGDAAGLSMAYAFYYAYPCER